MIAMLFEFWFDPGDEATYQKYLAEAAHLKETVLPALDGFLGIERFSSLSEPGKFISVGFFRDEDAVTAWRNAAEHRRVQALGRDRFFKDYRLRMAEITRDYSKDDRAEAPSDSRTIHG